VIINGDVVFQDYCSGRNDYASVGYLANDQVTGRLNFYGNQQYMIRNSEIGGAAGCPNGLWNNVFSGVIGAQLARRQGLAVWRALQADLAAGRMPAQGLLDCVLILIAGGMMMAMCRLNVPSIFIYGGSILPGNFRGQQVTVQDMFEAVGKHSVGEMSDADLDEIERVACPSAGACGAQFTANTMATVSEAIGLALPYSAGAPAPYEIRDAFCTTAGEKIMELIALNLRPRDIVTRRALENAAAVVAASGGSTNAALHLPAIAHECGIKFDLFDVAEIFKKTPYVADLKPGGRYVAKDMFEAGGIPLLMKTLLDNGYMHGDCLTVTGRTMA